MSAMTVRSRRSGATADAGMRGCRGQEARGPGGRPWRSLAVAAAAVVAGAAALWDVVPAGAVTGSVDLGTIGGASLANAVDGNLAVGQALTMTGSSRAFIYDFGAATPALVDISGGVVSNATAVSGNIVAGDQWNGTSWRAWVYDRSAVTPAMIPLGTLGGASSNATAVSGSIVVGSSDTASSMHPFAYDLSAVTPHMTDLGDLGGDFGRATAISGSIVVGWGYATGSIQHGFYDNLAAATPTMVDLGDLGGNYSTANAVSGSIIVGSAGVTGGALHAFAYDLSAVTPHLIDLGTLGGTNSQALAVSGSIVVGQSDVAGGAHHAFAYNLAAATPHMIDLGTLGGANSEAIGVSNGLVAGTSDTATSSHAFAYDLNAVTPTMLDRPAPDGGYSLAKAVSGGHIVGAAHNSTGVQHAAAWSGADPYADVTVSFAGGKGGPRSGKEYTLTATITNHGPQAAAGVTLAISTVNATLVSPTTPVSIGTVNAGVSVTQSITVRAGGGKQSMTVSGTVSTTAIDIVSSNDTGSISLAIKGKPA